MHRFNLSKFYTVNLLLWSSLAGNALIIICCCFLPIKNAHAVVLFYYYLKYVYYVFFVWLILDLITIAVEAILRITKILKSYSKITMNLETRTVLYWTAIIFILLDLIVFRISFLTAKLMHAPYAPIIHYQY